MLPTIYTVILFPGLPQRHHSDCNEEGKITKLGGKLLDPDSELTVFPETQRHSGSPVRGGANEG